LDEKGVVLSVEGLHMIVRIGGGRDVQGRKSCQRSVQSPADVYLASPEGELLFRKGDRRIGIREGKD
jgi:hypothetical protein